MKMEIESPKELRDAKRAVCESIIRRLEMQPKVTTLHSFSEIERTEVISALRWAFATSREAACVKACEGLSQDALDGGWTARGMSAYAKCLEERLSERAIPPGISRAEWHDKAWTLFHAKTFDDKELHKVNIHTIRAVFDATYDALNPMTTLQASKRGV